MRQLSITPSITVTIGRHTRLYFAFVTTAPAELDSPATVTLHAATFSDVVGLRRGPDHLRRAPRAERRHAWFSSTRWSSPGSGPSTAGISTCLLPADPVLVGLNTLQHWLWQRLQASTASEVRA